MPKTETELATKVLNEWNGFAELSTSDVEAETPSVAADLRKAMSLARSM